MVFTNLECWAVGGGAAENPQLMEHINLSGNNATANPFNPQQVGAGGAGVAAKVTNGYYGYSYIHAAHAAENINSASADAAAVAAACDTNNNESNNNNNNNNDRYYAGDYNTALKHTAEYGMQLMQNYVVFDEKDAAGAATLKRTRMDDDDRDNEKCAQERERVDFIAYAAEAAKLNREYALKRRPLLLQQSSLDTAVYYSGEESPIPTKRSRCGADVNGGDGGNEFIAAQYINDFFNMPAFQEQQQQQQLQQPQSSMMEMDSDMPAAAPVPELQAPSSQEQQQQQQQQQQAPYEQHYQANGIINTETKTQCINGNALWQQQQQQFDSNSTFTGNVTNKNSCCSLQQEQQKKEQQNFVAPKVLSSANGKCRNSSERSDAQLAALFFETHGGCIYNAEF